MKQRQCVVVRHIFFPYDRPKVNCIISFCSPYILYILYPYTSSSSSVKCKYIYQYTLLPGRSIGSCISEHPVYIVSVCSSSVYQDISVSSVRPNGTVYTSYIFCIYMYISSYQCISSRTYVHISSSSALSISVYPSPPAGLYFFSPYISCILYLYMRIYTPPLYISISFSHGRSNVTVYTSSLHIYPVYR